MIGIGCCRHCRMFFRFVRVKPGIVIVGLRDRMFLGSAPLQREEIDREEISNRRREGKRRVKDEKI